MQIKYSKPDFFYDKQEQIYNCDKQFSVVLSSNKTGKTVLAALWLNEQALLNTTEDSYCWLSPFSETSKIGYELIKKIIMGTPIYQHLIDINHKKQFKFNSSAPQRITYPNGSEICFMQGGNPKGIYGHKYKAAVVDEASRLKDSYNESGELECPAWEALQSCM